ncbi:hypothetical protein B0T20DRAFT_456994 [Sordaria brevicollis]|uniref:chitinase n=1 Tax=Sordaria brevicollis TaxID=83679 RepID=A0AAE0U2W7_SORBR|nr:hypothetical protein B0T20DRAFT_456994 [Sordaria brevicollis]
MHKSLVAAAVLAATARATAVSEPKVNVYWGQKGDTRLKDHCDQANFDYVTIGFVNNSPEQDKSGLNYPGTNFGQHCDGIYYTNSLTGAASPLLSKCTVIASDIQYCQEKGKKVLLSVGGAAVKGSNYSLSSIAKGEEFATFLWKAFGPYDKTWTGPRPFDFAGYHISVDGFDLDIEEKFSQAGQDAYVALAKKLRKYFPANGKYLLTAAPECPLDDEHFKMKSIISKAEFDALFIQFYNNPGCAAESKTGFNYNAWEAEIKKGSSKNAKLFVGLAGSPDAAGSGYIEPVKAASIINDLKKKSSFGGAMIWDAYHGQKVTNGKSFVDAVNTACHGVKATPTTTAAPGAPTTIGCTTYYTVQPGDYCYLIAQNYGITVTELIRFNPSLDALCAVQIGQQLCVRQGVVTLTSTTAPATTTTSTSTSSSSSSVITTSSSSVVSSSTEAVVSSSTEVVVSSTEAASSTITSAPAVSSTEAVSSSSEAVSTSEYCEDETTTSAPASETESVTSSVVVSESASVVTSEPASSTITSAPVVISSSAVSSEVPSSTEEDSCDDETTTASEVVSSTEAPVVSATESAIVSESASVTESASITESSAASVSFSTEVPTTTDDACEDETTTSEVPSATEGPSDGSSTTVDPSIITSAPVVVPSGSGVSEIISSTTSEDDSCDDEETLISEIASSTEAPVVSATNSAVVSSTEAPVVSATESAVPSDVVSESTLPSGIIPSGVIPSGVIPSGVVSSILSEITAGPTDGSVVPSVSVTIPAESGISSAPDAGVTSAPAEEWTTSTIYTTTVSTITSCAPEVTDCPGKIGQVTTIVVPIATTVCPVTAIETSSGSAPTGIITTSVPVESIPAGFTTSTIYTTTVSTVTSCAPTVTDCPGKIGQVTTVVVPIGVTVCPITEAFPPATSVPAAPSAGVPGAPGAPGVSSAPAVPSGGAPGVPSVPVPSGGAPGVPEVDTTSTTSVTSVHFTTVTVAKPTASAPGGGEGVPAESSPVAFPSEVPSGGNPSVPPVVNAPAVPSGTAPVGTGVSAAPSSAPSTYSMPSPPAQTEPVSGSEPSEIPVTAGAGRNVVAFGVPALMAALVLAF